MRRTRPPGALADLIATVRSDSPDEARDRLRTVAAARVPDLVALARAHGVEAWLTACAPPDSGQWVAVRTQREALLAAHMRQRWTMHVIGDVMTRLHRPWAVLKGASLADVVYPRADLRSSVDVDALVSPADFEQVVRELTDTGFTLIDLNWPVIRDRMPGELRLVSPNGCIVDLHWHLLNDLRLRECFVLPTNELLARRTHVGVRVPRLSDDDQLVHVALHAAMGGANKLSWLVDLDRLVRFADIDWDVVIRRTRAAQAGPPVALALLRTAASLDTPVPPRAIDALAGSRRVAFVERAVAARATLRTDPDSPGLDRAFSRSLRGDAATSRRELTRHGLGWLRSRRDGSVAGKPWLDPHDVRSALHPVDDDRARDAYYVSLKGDI